MNDSLAHFRFVCQDAFAFLVADFGFLQSLVSDTEANPYIVEFLNGEITLRIVGEGYGTVARVEYVLQDGRLVPSAVLESDWQPNARRKKLKRARPVKSQDEQIRTAAELIRARDQFISNRDYAVLREAADRWQGALAAYKVSSENRTERSRDR